MFFSAIPFSLASRQASSVRRSVSLLEAKTQASSGLSSVFGFSAFATMPACTGFSYVYI
jgi:hypothetical protein